MTRDERAWGRGDLTLTQRCYDESEVVGALVEAGFESVSVVAAANVGWEDVGRSFFVGRS